MCRHLKASRKKSAIIFKIVAKKSNDTRYYSIAMGFMYPKKAGRIPKVKVQHRIGTHFGDRILYSRAHEDNMKGRTAGFVNRNDAECMVSEIKCCESIHGHDVLVVKAQLTNGLMSGQYGDDLVIAGRHIEWLE